MNEQTRARIQQAAITHGYTPNRRAASLATGRAMAIGHVIPTSLNHEMVNPVFADFTAGAGEVYAREGYDMLMSVVADGEEMNAYRRMAATGAVDGVIVHGPRGDDPRIHQLRQLGLPFVVHGRSEAPMEDVDFVDVENRRAFRRATEHLMDLGHRRIALVNGDEEMDFAARRRAGYEEAHALRDVPVDPALLFASEMTETFGHDTASALLSAPEAPTAFLVSSLITAIGVRRAISDHGLTLGRDVSVVVHDDDLSYLRNGGEVAIFTATRSSVRAAGRRCAEILIERIRNPGLPPRQEVWECELVLGNSTGPAPSRP